MTKQVAIISGAGKGLGRAYALELAQRGIRVVVNNRTHADQPSSAEAVVNEIKAFGGDAIAHHGAADHAECGMDLVQAALSNWGRLDIVVANAGFDRPQSFHNQSLADFDAIMETNFAGTARLLHSAWPVLREANYGRIVVSTSTAGLFGNHGQAAYAASKAALIGLIRSLHLEIGRRDITINAIAPYAHTPLTDPWFNDEWAHVFTAQSVALFLCHLVAPDCATSGRTFIAGGGHVREARTLETPALPVSANDSPFAELTGLDAQLQPNSASEEFARFLTQ